MEYAGIICEYNPFHRGHMAHIAATRELSGENAAVICVMSGNYVQRGEPAIYPKHLRAEAALRGGADLVIELPTEFAVSSAERFARGGVAILASLGVPLKLSFASECGDTEALRAVAEALSADALNAAVSLELKAGVSYAAARERAARLFLGEGAELLREPNNILGIEYLKAIKALGAENISPVTIRRLAVAHDGGENGDFASASRIRELLRSGDSAEKYLPCPIDAPIADYAKLETAALYRLRTMEDSDFEALPDSGEGLWRRFMGFARSEATLDGVISGVKTKRYALSRIRRMALHALLGVTADMQVAPPRYIRVLGFNERGAEALHEIKRAAALPMITKPADHKELLSFEAKCTDIYDLMFSLPAGREWTTGPVRV